MATQVRQNGAWTQGQGSPVFPYPSLTPSDLMHGVYRGPWNTGVLYGTQLLPQTFMPSFTDGGLVTGTNNGITVTRDSSGDVTQILIDRVNWVGLFTITGTVLTQSAQSLTPYIKVTNSLFTACTDTGSIEIGAANFNNPQSDLVFQNCTFVNNYVGSPAVDGSLALYNCDLSGGADCIHFHDYTTVTDSYIHEPSIGLGVHSDLMQDLAQTHPHGVLIERNRLELTTFHRRLNHNDPHNRVLHGDYPTSLTITNNYMDGGTYSIDGQAGGTTTSGHNRFGRNFTYMVFYNQVAANRFGPTDVFHDTNTTVTGSV